MNDWIFDPNYRRAIKFGRDGLDQCCKYNENCGKYKRCKHIWIFTPLEKILKVKRIVDLEESRTCLDTNK